jgi:hypothetical protein
VPELAALRTRLAAVGRRIAMIALAIPGGPALLFGLGLLIPGTTARGLLEPILVALIVGTASGLLALRDAWRERAALARDLESGEALVFGGAAGGMPPLRVLGESRFLLRAVDELPSGVPSRVLLETVRVQAAAPPPAYAWRVAMADDLVAVGMPDGVTFEQRRLTSGELQEIESYARMMRRIGPRLVLAAACALVPFLDLAQRTSMPGWKPEPWSLVLVALGEILFFLTLRQYVIRYRLSCRLMVDHAAGRALTRVRRGEEEAPGPREFLPVSRRIWTEEGRPAPWRGGPPGRA